MTRFAHHAEKGGENPTTSAPFPIVKTLPTSLTDLTEKLQKTWCSETSYEPSLWSSVCPALGQCAVTAALVQDYFGGNVMRVHDAKSVNIHYYNVLPNGTVVDLTIRQYIPVWVGEPKNVNGVMAAFTRKSRRYKLLQTRLFPPLGAGAKDEF